MYKKLPNLVLGFHGCNYKAYQNVLYKQEGLKRSENSYDWLGHGIYFWEQNFARAEEWARKRYGDDNAYVIGAVIDLGFCLNLTDSSSSGVLKAGYDALVNWYKVKGEPLPQNRPSQKTNDILLRDLDCAVIQSVHDVNKNQGVPAYDSVRGVFVEGGPPYPGAEFRDKTHIQICVCNPNCIKGYFNPIPENTKYPMP